MKNKPNIFITILIAIIIVLLVYILSLKPKIYEQKQINLTPVVSTIDSDQINNKPVKSNTDTTLNTIKTTKQNYIIGKTYEYTNEGTTWKLKFIGYENKKILQGETKTLAAFNITENKYYTNGKVWDIHNLVLYPNTSTSHEKVVELTNTLNTTITQQPGIIYNGLKSDYYLITLQDNQNIFDAIDFYNKNETFKFVEPNWLSEGTLN